MQPDKDGYLPVMRVLERVENPLWRRDYKLVELLLEAMRQECDGIMVHLEEYKIEEGKPALLNAWANKVSLYHVEEERKIFDLIRDITDMLKGR